LHLVFEINSFKKLLNYLKKKKKHYIFNYYFLNYKAHVVEE